MHKLLRIWWSFFPSLRIRVYNRALQWYAVGVLSRSTVEEQRAHASFCTIMFTKQWHEMTERERQFLSDRGLDPLSVVPLVKHGSTY